MLRRRAREHELRPCAAPPTSWSRAGKTGFDPLPPPQDGVVGALRTSTFARTVRPALRGRGEPMWAALSELQDSAKKLAADQLSDFQAEYDTAQATAVQPERADFVPAAALLSPLSQIGTSVSVRAAPIRRAPRYAARKGRLRRACAPRSPARPRDAPAATRLHARARSRAGVLVGAGRGCGHEHARARGSARRRRRDRVFALSLIHI